MCTVTFIPREVGYYLAMNRDEQRTRMAGLPPKKNFIDGRWVMFPSEPGGGTWIAVNDSGTSLALVNWYSVDARVSGRAVSRGELVKAVSACATPDEVAQRLKALPIDWINPFRLVGIFAEDREVSEWQWDLSRLVRKVHKWKAQQWISSGFDELTAQELRSRTFRAAQWEEASGELGWLRRLHSSHAPHKGAFSTCMHRADAVTVSYTEIVVAKREAIMRYCGKAPCEAATLGDALQIQLQAADERRKTKFPSRYPLFV